MAKYKYTALKNNSELTEGEIEALDLREARVKIRELGFLPAKVYTEEVVQDEKPRAVFKSKVKHLSLAEKISFTLELEILLSSGIPILEALQSIENNSPYKKLVEISSNLRACIMSGMTFSQSLGALYSEAFGQVYIALMKTGENAGELEKTLERMLILLRKQQGIRDKIIQASIYPAVLLIIMFGLVIVFSKFVFPAFMGVITGFGGEVPYFAQILMGTFSFINNFWWLVLLMFGAACGAVVNLFKNPSIKSKWDNFILRVPVVSEFIKYINLANFMTVLHISYEAGVPIISGLELSNKTVGNYNIKKRVFNAAAMVRNGKTLSESFKCSSVVPDALMSMISAGEKSGTLGKMFHDAAEVIDRKVDLALEAMAKLFEPTVIIILGVVVLLIAIGFYQMYIGMLGNLF